MARIIQTATLDRASTSGDDREWIYNGLDCAVTLEILHNLRPQLDNLAGATYEFSKDLQAPVLEMALRGLRVDMGRRKRVLVDLERDIQRLASNLDRIIRDGIGTSASWRSPKQLGELLYGTLLLPPVRKRGAHGAMVPTTDRDALEKLGANYLLAEPICSHLLALRDLDKQRQFLESEVDSDGRIRTGPNIAGTNTGRLSCSLSDFGTGANLQTVDDRLRSIFIPDVGMEFANLDLEQGDSRNVGAICWNLFLQSHGERMAGLYLNACESGDLHSTVSEMVWTGIDPLAIAYRQFSYRFMAKKLGHGTNYYGSPRTMARHTKVDVSLIDHFQKNYFKAFPTLGVHDKKDHRTDCWHNRVRSSIHSSSQLTTMLGRRRFFYGNPADDETLRAAIAYEPQSMTADEINRGMLAVWRADLCQILLQVHDSILIQYPKDRRDEVLPKVMALMPVIIDLKGGRRFTVPVDAKVGMNWGSFNDDPKKGPLNLEGLKKWKKGT